MKCNRSFFFLSLVVAVFWRIDVPASYAEPLSQEGDTSILTSPETAGSLDETADEAARYDIFDDQMLLTGYEKKYQNESKEILWAMLEDDTLTPYKMAATVRVFRENFSSEVFLKEKRLLEKSLIHRLNKTDSPFVQVEIMHTLCIMDRYKYFKVTVPGLIQKLDHYNLAVNALAFESLNHIIATGNSRVREARFIFNILRKSFILSRKRMQKIKEPDERLKQKIELLRWSIKLLGKEQLERLPQEIFHLL